MTIAVVACRKESAIDSPLTNNTSVSVTPRVLAFIERTRTAAQRDGETFISADSAEWYVEAALNYSHTDLSKAYKEGQVDSVTYSIPLSDGIASVTDVIAAYNALGALINAMNVANESHVVLVDVTRYNTGEELRITASYVIGSDYAGFIWPPSADFGPTDYWQYGGVTGPNCNCGINPTQGYCADKKIQSRVNLFLGVTYNTYMTDVETWMVDLSTDEANNEYDYLDFLAPISVLNPDGGDGVRDYLTYACTNGGLCSMCLDPTDMTYYVNGTRQVMNQIRAIHCPNKVAQSCLVEWDIDLASLDPATFYHRSFFRYGKPQPR